MYLTLNWLGSSVLPAGGSKVVIKSTTRRGVKHANAENTIIATVLAARISLRRFRPMASCTTRIRLFCSVEILKIHACVTSIIPLGTKTASDIKNKKWGTTIASVLLPGIMLIWMQPRSNLSKILPLLRSIRTWRIFANTPSSVPIIQRKIIKAFVRFLVTKAWYLK